MPLNIKDFFIKGYDRVVHVTNEVTKLDCVISIHNTKLGPSLGGVRSWAYDSFADQKNDALKLSEAMTLKNSLCGINFGGGKAALNLKGIFLSSSDNQKVTGFSPENNLFSGTTGEKVRALNVFLFKELILILASSIVEVVELNENNSKLCNLRHLLIGRISI